LKLVQKQIFLNHHLSYRKSERSVILLSYTHANTCTHVNTGLQTRHTRVIQLNKLNYRLSFSPCV
jgi:hypothetical protein